VSRASRRDWPVPADISAGKSGSNALMASYKRGIESSVNYDP